MADAINHDGPSTVATVGSKAVKFGLLGGLAAIVLPILIGGAAILVAGPMIAAGTVGGIAGGIAVGALGLAGALATWGLGSAGAIIGGTFGILKGSEKVSAENSAFRSRVAAKMRGDENKDQKNFNDGENKGLEEGYQLATRDMGGQIEQREQAAFQKGQEVVVQQIQEQMMKAAQAEQGGAAPAVAAAVGAGALASAAVEQKSEKKFADGVAKANCECKAEAVLHEREAKAHAPAHHHV